MVENLPFLCFSSKKNGWISNSWQVGSFKNTAQLLSTWFQSWGCSRPSIFWWKTTKNVYSFQLFLYDTNGLLLLGLGYTETGGAIRCHLKHFWCFPLELFPSFFTLVNGKHKKCFRWHLMPPTRFSATKPLCYSLHGVCQKSKDQFLGRGCWEKVGQKYSFHFNEFWCCRHHFSVSEKFTLKTSTCLLHSTVYHY